MKKILLLGGSYQQIAAITAAKKLGYYTILCDYLPDNPGQYCADRFYPVSTTDMGKVLEIAKKEEISGIIAYASDPAAPTAAYVAGQLHLPANPFQTVCTMCDKWKFRSFLTEHGYSSPRTAAARELNEAVKLIHEMDYPVVIKPVDSSGSKGVSVVQNAEDFRSAAEKAFACSRAHRIVMEQFIENKYRHMIGGDIYVIDGKVVLWGLMSCHRDDAVNPLVPVGKSFPPDLEEGELAAVRCTLQNLITDLGFRFGEVNIEVMIGTDGCIYPVDLGPRAGGNRIPELIGRIYGCDAVEMSIMAACGERPVLKAAEPVRNLALHVIHSERDGILKDISISPSIRKWIISEVLYRKPGDRVRRFENSADAIGVIFLQFPNSGVMSEIMDSMREYILVETT